MVYVDEFCQWAPTRIRCFKDGSSHMTADNLSELHEMAKRIGMKREWFQDHPVHPHYDLTSGRRAAALRGGAVFVAAKAQARARMQAAGRL